MDLRITFVLLTLVYSVRGTRPSNICPQSTPCVCKNDGLLASETEVDCQLRKLNGVPTFEGIGKARKINLSRNKLTKLDANTFAGITTPQIDLSGNMISTTDELAFAGLENSLETLILKSNKFSTIPTQSLKRLGKLKVLNFDNNPGLVAINGSDFQGLSQLETLSLKKCSIACLHEGSFVGLDNLRELVLYNNDLKEISSTLFLPLTSLQELDLGFNLDLDHMPARAFRHITSLSLSMNNFSSDDSFDPAAFADVSDSLELLKLDHCRMKAVPSRALKQLTSLKQLNLNGNQIRRIEAEDLSGLSSLEHLTLDDNRHLHLALHGLSKVAGTLKYLSMRDMNLKAIPLEPLQDLLALEWLDVSENSFESLGPGALEGICATRFEITHSHLQRISKEAFRNTPNNLRLNLKGNVIDSMEFLEQPCKFEEADVDAICDCALYKLLKTRKIQLKGKCRLPRDLEGITVDSKAYKLISRERCERNSTNFWSDHTPNCPLFDPSETGELSPARCSTVSRDDAGETGLNSSVNVALASTSLTGFLNMFGFVIYRNLCLI
ncbi:insulin-like growth factor-binding protein complex acid labile subunit [Liolophura sinensis]|uniref:insulin-like growth factor-binding protein complex acid labile subunit n=1 Tax=Liolophura sinensis TaxID=3198878 RepID=UPI0031582B81